MKRRKVPIPTSEEVRELHRRRPRSVDYAQPVVDPIGGHAFFAEGYVSLGNGNYRRSSLRSQ